MTESNSVRIETPELQEVGRYLREQMNDVADHVAGGGCVDWADYQQKVGYVKALAVIEARVVEIDRNLVGAD